MRSFQDLQENENQRLDKNNARNYIITYLDGILRGLVSFLVIGIGLYILLVGIFKMSFIFVLPIIFIITIMVSPFLSKIKLGEKLINKYDTWLRKVFNLK
jgi:hypothetical protein